MFMVEMEATLNYPTCNVFPALLLQYTYLQILSPFILFIFFLRRSFTLVTQAGVQWHDLGSPQPPSASWVQAILLPQPPELLGLQACATMPS